MTLEKLIHEIKTGVFLPDVTRSGRLLSQEASASANLVEVKAEQFHGVIVVEDSESNLTTSDSS